MSFSEEEIAEFKSEAFEMLDEAETTLLNLHSGEKFKDDYEIIFRCFHNLKGAAGMMELESLQKHTHEIESIFMTYKESDSLSPDMVDFFLRATDAARSILNGESIKFNYDPQSQKQTTNEVSDNSVEESPDELSEFYVESHEIVDRLSDSLLKIEKNGCDASMVDSIYREIHSLKGAAYLFNVDRLGEFTHAIEFYLDSLRANHKDIPVSVMDSFYTSLEIIEKILEEKKTGKELKNTTKQIVKLTKFFNNPPEDSTEVIKPIMNSVEVMPMSDEPKNEEKAHQNEMEEKILQDAEKSASTVRVSVQLLDKLMALMGEMVLVRNQVLQYSNDSDDLDFHNLSKRLNVVTSEIQEEMMKTRMQPIGNVVNKFQRVVRDLSKSLGKEINLHIEGADTELDKSLLESIKDPLTHIVRNSCDHGVESTDVRVKNNKNRVGNIWIRSYHEGGQVVIEVRDDGKGLDKRAIIQKALEKGLVNPGQVERMVDSEIHSLVFAPGFSTAAKVTNVSGRGVGMDVVATNIESIGGTVEIDSQFGKGATFTIKVPLTLAIVPALIVNCNNSTFAVPQVKLLELVRVDQSSDEKIENLQGAPVFRLRGDILPLINLSSVLDKNLDQDIDLNDREIVNIAVVQADNQCFGLIVDSVRDTADIVVKPLNRLLKSLQVYSGATVLGDGSVALILDVQGIARVMDVKAAQEKAQDKVLHDMQENQINRDKQDYLLVSLASQTKHAIVLNYVHRLEEFSQKDIETSGDQKVIRYRNSVLPLVDCDKALGFKVTDNDLKDNFSVIVVERAGKYFGLKVDQILDTLLTDSEMQDPVQKQDGILGHLNLEEELVVVIDPFELIASEYPDFEKNLVQNVSLSVVEASEKALQVGSLNQKVGESTILVVEDTPLFRKVVKSSLEKAGHKVTVACDGEEAVQVLKHYNEPFDLIVSDIEMPRMDGFDLAKAIRENPIHGNTPMLALSSRFDANYRKRGQQVGYNMYLEKFKPEQLNQKVVELLKNQKGAA